MVMMQKGDRIMSIRSKFLASLAGLFLFMLCASSPAGAGDLELFSSLSFSTLRDAAPGSNRISRAGCFSDIALPGVPDELGQDPAARSGDCLGGTIAIPLSRRGDTIVWSLDPSFTTLSSDPLEIIRSTQLLFHYRF